MKHTAHTKKKAMQIKNSDYNAEIHDRYKALTVKQPYAQRLVSVAFLDDDGTAFGEKSIEVRSRTTNYRGDLLICSSAKPEIPGMQSGVTLGFVELYDVKPVEDFTEQDWENTCIPMAERPQRGFGWLMRNPRRVVEMSCNGQLGIYNFVTLKGDITEYPTTLKLGKEGWRMIQKKIKDGEND